MKLSLTTNIGKFKSSTLRYGYIKATIGYIKNALKSLYFNNSAIVFVIPDFKGYKFIHPYIKVIDNNRIKLAKEKEELSLKHLSICNRLLEQGCIGIYAEKDNKFAGYAWVQLKGIYPFPFEGAASMNIPQGYTVMRNLFVLNEYRGMRIGQILNAARLALVNSGQIPVGFIIPENKYAIRNWEKYGFQRQFIVYQRIFLNGLIRIRFKDICDSSHTKTLKESIKSTINNYHN